MLKTSYCDSSVEKLVVAVTFCRLSQCCWYSAAAVHNVQMTELCFRICNFRSCYHTATILWPFFWDHPGEPVLEENFWSLWHKGRLTEVDTPTIQLGATPSGLTSAHLHHPPCFTGRMPFLLRPTNSVNW